MALIHTSPIIYIAIVNYGRFEDTRMCVESLLSLEPARLRVVLVDNGSPGSSAAEIALWLRDFAAVPANEAVEHRWLVPDAPPRGGPSLDIMYIASAENLGFAGGCNIGIAVARADPACDYVWLLNNDTIVHPRSLSALVARFGRGEDIGMCGSTLLYHDPPGTVQACGGRFNILLGRGTPIGALRRADDLPSVAEVERRIDYVVGASMLVSRRFLEKVGPMDDRYFLYFEELDWTLRGKAKGFRPAWAPDSVVVHKEGATIGSAQRGRPTDLALYFMTASYLRLVAARRAMLLPVALLRTVVNVAKWLMRRDIRAARTVASAFWGFIVSPRRSPGLQEFTRSRAASLPGWPLSSDRQSMKPEGLQGNSDARP